VAMKGFSGRRRALAAVPTLRFFEGRIRGDATSRQVHLRLRRGRRGMFVGVTRHRSLIDQRLSLTKSTRMRVWSAQGFCNWRGHTVGRLERLG
jgi:hypothetical protein